MSAMSVFLFVSAMCFLGVGLGYFFSGEGDFLCAEKNEKHVIRRSILSTIAITTGSIVIMLVIHTFAQEYSKIINFLGVFLICFSWISTIVVYLFEKKSKKKKD